MNFELNGPNTLLIILAMAIVALLLEPSSDTSLRSEEAYKDAFYELIKKTENPSKNCSSSLLAFHFAWEPELFDRWVAHLIKKERLQRDTISNPERIIYYQELEEGRFSFDFNEIFVKDKLFLISLESRNNAKTKFDVLQKYLTEKYKEPRIKMKQVESELINQDQANDYLIDTTIYNTWFNKDKNQVIELVHKNSNRKVQKWIEPIESRTQLNYYCVKNFLEVRNFFEENKLYEKFEIKDKLKKNRDRFLTDL